MQNPTRYAPGRSSRSGWRRGILGAAPQNSRRDQQSENEAAAEMHGLLGANHSFEINASHVVRLQSDGDCFGKIRAKHLRIFELESFHRIEGEHFVLARSQAAEQELRTILSGSSLHMLEGHMIGEQQ